MLGCLLGLAVFFYDSYNPVTESTLRGRDCLVNRVYSCAVSGFSPSVLSFYRWEVYLSSEFMKLLSLGGSYRVAFFSFNFMIFRLVFVLLFCFFFV